MSHPLNTPLGRFGIVTSKDAPDECVASIPVGGMVNPLNGAPTIAPLAMLVDHACGLVNHRRRAAEEWTVSSELSLEAVPDAADIIAGAPDVPVVATAQPFGRKSDVVLATCELAHRGIPLATATVRSFYIRSPGDLAPFPDGPTGPLPPGTLAHRMAVRIAESGGAGPVLLQDEDPVLNNSLGIVHGGVSAMALELVASAALNTDRLDRPLRTSSLHVNFLRPFHSGAESRYAGTVLRVGRSTGVGEAKAIGPGGEAAIIARLTAYRAGPR
ncbi:phenylacetic acid degradation protein [Mycolicibacterium celeriflavum]|uniref:Phenylacetic acid degradation protein n=1 Tax=Mycolicibacterium celeriflavum TaxID=1249101 RepID=A0A1X0C1L2_MYCCF|nr:PaaI family thioesterase [Mycolicibacterium celeriflavum]MCV7238128.1 PaaI family thioesterase [Mycolicibacterium celeriflavum]OBG12632.1 phenylacetic acid degradation protein [Mycolicibacterium celeriflavum]ORA51177.1 phenylacetic acid degradation protein [Mycolicibacterium celeriflavum]BBY45068.1 phenylacetic acid degradation protein [Mycolicibacterium celeriflavum]